MPNLAAGTIVAVKACPNCRADVHLKLNKNGMAYFYCNGSDGAAPCSHHERYGRAASQRLQSEFIQKTRKSKPLEAEHDTALEPIEPANDNTKTNPGNFLYGT